MMIFSFSFLSRLFVLTLLTCSFAFSTATAGMRDKPPEKIDAIIIGDRALDVAFHLGVMPPAMSIRGSSWSAAKRLKMAGQIIGCPNRITVMDKQALPRTLKEYGIRHIIIEKSDPFCLFKPKVKPENAAKLVEDQDIRIDYIDFTKGVPSAIDQMGELLDRKEKAAELKASYTKSLARAQKALPSTSSGKKVVVFNGVMQEGTGKGFLRIEAPGFYSDKLFLEPLKMINVGASLIADKKIDKGHLTVRRIDRLIEAQPDIIALTGDPLPFQRLLTRALKKNPQLASVPAIRNHAIYALPVSIGSSVIDYPNQLTIWSKTLQ